MLLDIIYLVCSRPMPSHHVTCHVTTVTCLFIINKKKNKIKKKKNIKSRKIDKRKRKRLVLTHIITYGLLLSSSAFPIFVSSTYFKVKSNLNR